jgi:hypothetical protein
MFTCVGPNETCTKKHTPCTAHLSNYLDNNIK